MTLAGDAVTLFDDHANRPLDKLNPLAESLKDQEARQQHRSEIGIPGLVKMASLMHFQPAAGRSPGLAALACLHFKMIVPRRKPAVTRAAAAAGDPISVIGYQTITKLNLRGIG